jgi:hypothetical protein
LWWSTRAVFGGGGGKVVVGKEVAEFRIEWHSL